tara:strand:- start:129 stop:428 length:300 start_codon:yes stop_codon:yes gene_type:complete
MNDKIKKTDELFKILQMFDDMSKDLRIGRLTNSEKDILLKINHEIKSKGNDFVDIRLIKFHDFFGEPIPRSTLYKSLKSLVKKKLVKHLGSERSSLYSV